MKQDLDQTRDYEPLDVSALCDAGLAILGEQAQAPIGPQVFRGLPFLIGGPAADPRSCFLGFGHGLRADPLTIPVNRAARRIIVAHRLLESEIEDGGMVGKAVAEYVFHLASGASLRVPIRERFQISHTPPSMWVLPVMPFEAVYSENYALHPRYEGRWDDAGQRQQEIVSNHATPYYLWTWTNPHPDQVITSVEVIPAGPRFIISAVTLGHLDENPFVRTGPRELRMELLRPEDATKPFDLVVEVDRGVATYPYALPACPVEEFLAQPAPGWGEARNPTSSPAYVQVAAIPSATVTVRQDGEALGSVRWSELEERGQVQPSARLRIELVDPGRNWVHTTVLDDETGKPVPCRIHLRSPDGIPYQPHGHHNHLNAENGTWHFDIGGDVRMGQITYAYTDGRCQGWLPRSDVIVDVARGFEYEPLRTRVTIAPGQQELALRIKRWRNMNAERWFSGDTHVHFLSSQGAHTEAKGEDLNVVNLLQAQWGHLFTSTEEFTGGPSVSADGQTIVYVSQENRQHFLGHMILLGLKEPVMPWGTGGPNEGEMGGTLEVTMADWADRCHAQGGTVVIPHFPLPNAEQAALIATGRVDAVEMLRHRRYNHLEYYRYLNGGYRLPLVGGTDKMTAETPVGLYRTYVYIPPEEEFNYENWCRNLARGRTFMTSGPLLRFSVEGHAVGDTLTLPASGGTVECEAVLESIFPIHSLEIVQGGHVVASTEEPKGARRLELRAQVKVEGHTWLAARAGGPGYFQSTPHHDILGRGLFAHTSPIYVACGGEWSLRSQETAQYMLTMIEGSLAYIRHKAAHYPPDAVTHHHGEDDHRAYLERPFLQAREAVEQRLRSGPAAIS